MKKHIPLIIVIIVNFGLLGWLYTGYVDRIEGYDKRFQELAEKARNKTEKVFEEKLSEIIVKYFTETFNPESADRSQPYYYYIKSTMQKTQDKLAYLIQRIVENCNKDFKNDLYKNHIYTKNYIDSEKFIDGVVKRIQDKQLD